MSRRVTKKSPRRKKYSRKRHSRKRQSRKRPRTRRKSTRRKKHAMRGGAWMVPAAVAGGLGLLYATSDSSVGRS